jgi:HD-like signal output (HDOD) protein
MQCLWRHNLACALIAQQLAAGGFMDKDIAYASGVMHDIGRFALSVIRPKEYAELLGKHVGSADSILQCERDLFGWDHCEVGHQLVVDWKLPSDFEAIVSEHHAPRRTDGSWGMAELMKVSCRMADVAGFSAFQGCEVVPFAELLEEIPERERKHFYSDVDVLIAEVSAKIQVLESL